MWHHVVWGVSLWQWEEGRRLEWGSGLHLGRLSIKQGMEDQGSRVQTQVWAELAHLRRRKECSHGEDEGEGLEHPHGLVFGKGCWWRGGMGSRVERKDEREEWVRESIGVTAAARTRRAPASSPTTFRSTPSPAEGSPKCPTHCLISKQSQVILSNTNHIIFFPWKLCSGFSSGLGDHPSSLSRPGRLSSRVGPLRQPSSRISQLLAAYMH